jgi:hypothetical protein
MTRADRLPAVLALEMDDMKPPARKRDEAMEAK